MTAVHDIQQDYGEVEDQSTDLARAVPKVTVESFPFITVVMPIRNEERFIADTLDQLLAQDYPADRYEIIVADGQSTDRTPEIVALYASKHPQIHLYPNPGMLSSCGRNVGFKNGKGDLFVVVDGHCLLQDDKFLRNVADCFERSGADCLGRPQPFVVPEEPTMQRAIALARSSSLGHSSNSYIHANKECFVSPVSMGCAYTREVFEEIGFVDEAFDACEDVEFNYRVEKAGYKTFFSPKIAVKYYPRETLGALFRQLARYGKGRARFMFKHPDTLNVDMMLPIFFLLGVVVGPLLGYLHPYFTWAYIATVTLYGALLVRESFELVGDNNPLFAVKLASALVVTHVSLGVGICSGITTQFLSYVTSNSVASSSTGLKSVD